MSLTSNDIVAGTCFAEIDDLFWRRRLRVFLVPLAILGYFIYIFFAFDIAGLAAKARPDNAAVLLSDFWSYKTQVSRDNRSDEVTVAIEGERRGTYPKDKEPAWVVHRDGATVITLPKGAKVTYSPKAAEVSVPDFGTIHLALEGRRVILTLPEGQPMPDWISASRTRVSMDHGDWRFSMTPNRTETFRYFPGWELFFFTLDSPFHGKSLPQLVSLALSEKRVNPEMSNLSAMFGDFWNNKMWHHRDVFLAMYETILMAFLGTMGAGLIALPLAFLAAANFTPLNAIRLTLRRFFDFLRGVDGLIWTVILSRAFGPGPLTGTLAILMTDTGTFGKMFSEALENIDDKQIEGVNSTGANALQRARFGVIPQLAPVILSQLLYYFESNTRSATIIGALVGGGIGLLLTQAIITGKDWEEVSYYVILIVLTVMAMDTISGWLRRRFIKG